MTAAEIGALPAGRELDALVMRHVLGRRQKAIGPPDDQSLVWETEFGGWVEKPPPYSTDIAAAYEMEEAISARGLTVAYSRAMLSLFPAPACTEGRVDIYEVWHLLHASPEQRCRAALLATEAVRARAAG